jgi:hypothetical protein
VRVSWLRFNDDKEPFEYQIGRESRDIAQSGGCGVELACASEASWRRFRRCGVMLCCQERSGMRKDEGSVIDRGIWRG